MSLTCRLSLKQALYFYIFAITFLWNTFLEAAAPPQGRGRGWARPTWSRGGGPRMWFWSTSWSYVWATHPWWWRWWIFFLATQAPHHPNPVGHQRFCSVSMSHRIVQNLIKHSWKHLILRRTSQILLLGFCADEVVSDVSRVSREISILQHCRVRGHVTTSLWVKSRLLTTSLDSEKLLQKESCCASMVLRGTAASVLQTVWFCNLVRLWTRLRAGDATK